MTCNRVRSAGWRCAVRTGCRYLADERQKTYVRDGWNLTGDSFTCDENGVYHFAARSDDMIISSGYKSPDRKWKRRCFRIRRSSSVR